MFLTHAENRRPVASDTLIQAFTATEVHLDQPFFVCTRMQFFDDKCVRTTALLMFEDDLRELMEEDQSHLVDLMMLMPHGLGWKVSTIENFWDEFSCGLGQNILVFKDDSGRLETLWRDAEIPPLSKLPVWSRVDRFSKLCRVAFCSTPYAFTGLLGVEKSKQR